MAVREESGRIGILSNHPAGVKMKKNENIDTTYRGGLFARSFSQNTNYSLQLQRRSGMFRYLSSTMWLFLIILFSPFKNIFVE